MIIRSRWQKGFRGLGQYDDETGFIDSDPSLLSPGSPGTTNNDSLPRPSACSWYDYIWPTEACSLALGQQQIQQVPINAASAGYPVPVVAATQDTANQQSQDFAVDNALIFNPPTSSASTWPWYYWALLAAGLFVAVEVVAKK
jgi:hypothetical protein